MGGGTIGVTIGLVFITVFKTLEAMGADEGSA